MNIYDLDMYNFKSYAYDSQALKLIRHSKRLLKICTTLLIFSIPEAIYFIAKSNKVLFWSVLCFLVVICFLLWAGVCETKRKCKACNISYKVLHDYNYYKYITVTNKKQRTGYLLELCRCDLLTFEYEQAENALSQIDYSSLSKMNEGSYLILKSIICKYKNDEEKYNQCLEYYLRLKSSEKGDNTYEYIMNVFENGDINEIMKLASINSYSETNYRNLVFTLSLLIIMTGTFAFYEGKNVLPGNLEYRSWFDRGGSIFFLGADLIILFIYFKNVMRMRNREGRANRKIRGTVPAFIIIILMIGTILLDSFNILKVKNEEMIPEGFIKVIQANGQKEENYYCTPYNIFLRQIVGAESNSSNNNHNSNETDARSENDSQKSGAAIISDNSKTKEVTDNRNSMSYEDDDEVEIEKCYRKIYDSELKDSGYTMEFRTSAKGRSYVSLSKDSEVSSQNSEAGSLNKGRRLVYDRESKNGQCYLFVYYEDTYSSDGNVVTTSNTEILNFYAVVKSSGKIISGDKTSWEDSSSEEYRKETGEY